MNKLEVIIQPYMLDDVKQALTDIGVESITVSEVRGHGPRSSERQVYRGAKYNLAVLPKVKIELVVPSEQSEDVVRAVSGVVRRGKFGDGKIFVSDISDAVRIRTGQRGEFAL